MTAAHTTNGKEYQMQLISPDQLLSTTEGSRLNSNAKSIINLWLAKGKFPKPITLSPTIKVWRNQNLKDWIEFQMGASESILKNIDSKK